MRYYLSQATVILTTLSVVGLWFVSATFTHAFNPEINYQGKLLNASSTAVANGNYDMTFRLYTVATGGTAVWTEARTVGDQVTVTNGLFSVMLGEVTSLSGVDFNQTLYLGVTVGADDEMIPRKILGTVPAAFIAERAIDSDTVGGVASSSLVRNDATSSVEASAAGTLFSFIQNGAGAIARFFSGVTEVFTILSNGNVGVGTSTPSTRFTVAGDALVTGTTTMSGLTLGSDSVTDLTGVGLEVVGGALQVATSSLGITGSLFTDGGATTYLTSLSDNLAIGTTTTFSLARLTVEGSVVGTGGIAFDTVAFFSDLDTGFQTAGVNVLGMFTGGINRGVIDDVGNFGLGTTTPGSRLTVQGDINLTGALRANGNAGTSGQVLQSTGGGLQWVATSSLGITGGASTFLGLTDTPSSFTPNRVLFTNAAGNAVTDSANFLFNGSGLGLGGITPTAALTLTASTTATGGIRFGADVDLFRGTDNRLDLGSGDSLNLVSGNLQIFGTNYLTANNTTKNVTLGEGAGDSFAGSGTGRNVAIGFEAGQNASTTGAIRNIYIGQSAGRNNTGSTNNLFGFGAGFSNTGSNNNLFGSSAGYFNTGSTNNLFGFGAGLNNTGSFSEFIGFETGGRMSASNTVAIGQSALRGGAGDVLFGGNAATTTNNTALGAFAGFNVQTGGNNNILLGFRAADSLTTGANNIIIGYDVEAPSNTASNQLNIGNLIFGTGIDGTGTTLSSGNIGIGTTTPSAKLAITGTTGSTTDLFAIASSTNARLLTFTSTGRLGLGTTSPTDTLSIVGGINLTGAFRANGNAGTAGMVLQTTGTGTQWVATSSLNIARLAGLGLSLSGNTLSLDINGLTEETTFTTGDFLAFYDTTAGTIRKVPYSSLPGAGGGLTSLNGLTTASQTFATSSDTNIGLNIVSSGSTHTFTPTWSGLLAATRGGTGLGTITANQLLIGGAGNTWAQIATSSLGLRESLFTDGGATSFLTSLGDNLALGTTSALARLAIQSQGSDDILNLFETGGQEVFTVLENGNVGVGTTTPSTKFAITGTAGTEDIFAIASSTNARLLTFTSTGRLGIGTTSPSSKLDVWGDFRVGTSSTPAFFVDTANDTVTLGSTVSGGIDLWINKTRVDGSVLTVTTNEGTTVDSLALMGVSTGVEFANTQIYQTGGAMPLSSLESGSANTGGFYINQIANAFMSFSTNDTERMRIDATGNVGIGTTTPTARLAITGTAGTGDIFAIASSTNARLLTFTSTGRLGLGTTSPTDTLSIAGDMNLTGALRANGNAGTSGMVLQTTGSGTQWVATSTLGFAAAGSGTTTFLGLTDTPSSYVTDRILFMSGSGVATSTNFTFNGTNLVLGGTTGISLGGDVTLNRGATNRLDLATGDSLNLVSGSLMFNASPILSYSSSNGTIALGNTAGLANSGSSNNLIGELAGGQNSGAYNNFIGEATGVRNLGSFNILLGFEAGALASATNTVAVGREALRGGGGLYLFDPLVVTSNNTALGAFAGYLVQTGGDNNILLGFRAADSLTTGANNIIIGYDVEAPSNTASNQLNIGNLIFGTGINGTGTTTSTGNIGIGTTTPVSRFALQNLGFSGAGTIGITQNLQSTNSSNGAVQFGNFMFNDLALTATTTYIGSLLRVADSTSLGNIVRGLEVQVDRGTNTQGENTAISGFARTFGIRGVTEGDAGGLFEPAGGFFETRGTIQGNALRGFSNTITSANMMQLLQASSTFSGTGLVMNFGTAGGAFTGRFVDFQEAGTSVFSVLDSGNTFIEGSLGLGTSTPATKLQVIGDIRVGTTGTNGCIERFDGTALTGTCSSDEMLKTNISSLSATSGASFIERFAEMQVVSYKWNKTAADLYRRGMDTTAIGVLAQNVEVVFPELVARDSRGFRTVDLSTMSFYLIEAMKEIWDTVLAMRERVDTKELCLEDVCITADELRDLLEQAAASAPAATILYGSNSTGAGSSTIEPDPALATSSDAAPQMTPDEIIDDTNDTNSNSSNSGGEEGEDPAIATALPETEPSAEESNPTPPVDNTQ